MSKEDKLRWRIAIAFILYLIGFTIAIGTVFVICLVPEARAFSLYFSVVTLLIVNICAFTRFLYHIQLRWESNQEFDKQ